MTSAAPPHLDPGAEISDVIVDFDAAGFRRPVNKAAAVDLFRGAGNSKAARIVEAMPAVGGDLDPEYVDRLLIRVHAEMQRVAEEFQHGRRVLELLRPLVAACRDQAVPPP